MAILDSGTSSSAGTGTFTDNTKSWTVNEYVGRIAKNTTTNKSARITANTSDTITAAVAFTGGDTYQIIKMQPAEPIDIEEVERKRPVMESEVLGMGTDADRIGRDYGID